MIRKVRSEFFPVMSNAELLLLALQSCHRVELRLLYTAPKHLEG